MDGDACPKPIKQILFRTAMKQKAPFVHVIENDALSTKDIQVFSNHLDKIITQHDR